MSDPEDELVELAWQEVAIRLGLDSQHCGWFRSWLKAMLIDYASGLYEASRADPPEAHQGFEELMTRLYNDRPILPCSDYGQDVAFLAMCFDKWRMEANKRGQTILELEKRVADAQATIRSLLPPKGAGE